ncbi:MAG TPA: glycosyltransferase N-terminal domain-containing protein [Chitinophagaceae bacterium]|nr:glycosyltransferase N-terminal domain-containing protein [Chitinophagaceae bacterium]
MNAFTFAKIKNLSGFFYTIFLWLYRVAVGFSSIWNEKARKWVNGRKNIFDKIELGVRDSKSGIVWVHCSSLGEFEQGKPFMEKIKVQYPNHKLLITFFSPSGYEVKKDYNGADHVFYLPMDSQKNARKFLDIVKPTLVVFIKYDYWYYYLSEIKRRSINCLLVSAVFREDQAFFKWYGGLQRDMLNCFTQIFVQNEVSRNLLETINVKHCSTSGDTRFDTVVEISEKFERVPLIESFMKDDKTIVAGSTWPKDEEFLQTAFNKLGSDNIKLIIAPHEIHHTHLDELKRLFPAAIRFSELTVRSSLASSVLIIDNIGMLSRLYRYAFITYVGGGFTKDGVHNVLEAAVYGKPVVFGNNYKKYKEAADLVKIGGAISFSDSEELYNTLTTLLDDQNDYGLRSSASKHYVQENRGATEKVLNYIEMNRLLTR